MHRLGVEHIISADTDFDFPVAEDGPGGRWGRLRVNFPPTFREPYNFLTTGSGTGSGRGLRHDAAAAGIVCDHAPWAQDSVTLTHWPRAHPGLLGCET